MPMNTTLLTPAAAVAGPAGGPHDLLDDLAGREVAGEAGLAGGAEPAPHRAAGLARHAHRGPVGVEHQHGLDPARRRRAAHRNLTVSPSSLTDSVTGVSAGGSTPASRSRSAFGRFVISAGSRELLVEALPHLVDAVARLAGEQLGELRRGRAS